LDLRHLLYFSPSLSLFLLLYRVKRGGRFVFREGNKNLFIHNFLEQRWGNVKMRKPIHIKWCHLGFWLCKQKKVTLGFHSINKRRRSWKVNWINFKDPFLYVCTHPFTCQLKIFYFSLTHSRSHTVLMKYSSFELVNLLCIKSDSDQIKRVVFRKHGCMRVIIIQ
jgi:hypothetical protein